MTDEAADTPPAQQRSLVGHVADCFVYAPLGLAFDARDLFPTLVAKGRNQVMIAKVLGRFAVQQGAQVGRTTVRDLGVQAVSLLPGVDLGPDQAPAPADGSGAGSGSGADEATVDGSRGDGAVGEGSSGSPDGAEPTPSTPSTGSTPAADEQGFAAVGDAGPPVAVPPVDVTTLAIPDYDSLSALQVVPRLDGLTTAELEAVGRYEAATRGRKTILNKVAQLQAG